jgi:uncharacterized surface protein with fasciclin (FAS1) repeats
MKIDRLLAGAAVATLMATSAFAQSGSTPSPTTSAAPAAAAAQPGSTSTTTPSTTQGATPGADQSATAPAVAEQTIITPAAGANIIAELKSAGQFTTLLKLLDTDGLTAVIQTHPDLTLIAPTDAAFAALPAGQLDTIKKDPTQLRALLTYHLIAAKMSAEQVKGHAAGKVATASGKEVSIDGSGSPLKINDANVIQSGVPASNGVIYVVDKVLTPTA